jgi:hypothetical protein
MHACIKKAYNEVQSKVSSGCLPPASSHRSSDKWSLNVRLPQERDADYSSRCCHLLRLWSKCKPSFVCAADRHPATFKDLAESRGEVGFRNLKLSDMGRAELQMLPGSRTHSSFQRLNFRACILEAFKSKTEWNQQRN